MSELCNVDTIYVKDVLESRLQELKCLLSEFSKCRFSCKVDIENEIRICERVLSKLK
jgi:hypothetical protein